MTRPLSLILAGIAAAALIAAVLVGSLVAVVFLAVGGIAYAIRG